MGMNNYQAECEIIGPCLNEASYIERLNLAPEDFHDIRNRSVWSVMLSLHNNNAAVSIETVAEMLNRYKPDEAEWISYLSLVSLQGSFFALETNARIVADYAIRRRAVEYASQLATAATDLTTNFQERQASIVGEVAKNAKHLGQAQPISSWLEETLAEVEHAYNHAPEPPLLSGFADLDNIIGGFRPGMCIITGKPGLGKTMLVENMARNLSKQYPGAFYSFEMSREDITYRMLSGATGVRISAMLTGNMEDKDYLNLVETGAELSKQAIYASATPATVAQLRADLTRLKVLHNIRWFVLDYLELLTDEFAGSANHERTGILSRHVTRLCRELELVGFVVQRMNKSGVGDNKPDMDSLAGSAEVMYHAAYIIAMLEHTPETGGQPDPQMRTLLIQKGRFLETTVRFCHLYKHPNRPQFENAYQRKEKK